MSASWLPRGLQSQEAKVPRMQHVPVGPGSQETKGHPRRTWAPTGPRGDAMGPPRNPWDLNQKKLRFQFENRQNKSKHCAQGNQHVIRPMKFPDPFFNNNSYRRYFKHRRARNMVKPTLHGSENECASAYVSLHLAPATIASIKTLVRYSHFTTIWLCSKSVMNAT